MLFFSLLLVWSNNSMAQQLHTQSKKAKSYHQKALEFYRVGNLIDAELYSNKAIEKDSCFMESLILMAQITEEQNNIEQSIFYYGRAITCSSTVYPELYLYRGNLHYLNGEYQKSINDFQKLMIKTKDKRKDNLLNEKIAKLNMLVNLTEKKLDYNPIRLSDSINTAFDEYAAQISFDNSKIIFTRADNTKRIPKEDIFSSEIKNQYWTKAKNAQLIFNTQGNEGSTTLSADMRYMVFAACNRPDGYGRCDIYYSKFDGQNWSLPKNIGTPINTKDWESQPSISADGNTLYFVSNCAGGEGKADIWMSTKNEKGQWQKPTNAGKTINTPENESYPFIHANNNTLYFGSQGHCNLGGYDIFYAKRDSQNNWLPAKNLGYPINSNKNENSIFVHPNGKTALIATNKYLPENGLDIYQFNLASEIKIEACNVFKGIVLDKTTKKPIKAQVVIENSENANFTTNSFANNGKFKYIAPSTSKLKIYIYATNYTFYTEEVDNPFESKEKIFYLSKLNNKSKTTFHFNFAFDSDELPVNDILAIKHLAEYLKFAPKLKISIEGHTDSRGSATYNQTLSLKRAEAVYHLLIESGISKDRMVFVGHGPTIPLIDNNTEINRAKNRRTEIVYVIE